MGTTASQDENTVIASSEATSSITQTRSTTGGTQNTASTNSIHHTNRYGSYSTHNQPVYTGPVYHIERAEFTAAPSPPLFLPPPTADSPPTSSSGPSQATTLSSPGIASTTSSPSALAGRWVYVPEGENQASSSSSRPERANPEDDEELDYPVDLHPDVVQTSKDFEEELKSAFMGFLSKEHRPWKPPQSEESRKEGES